MVHIIKQHKSIDNPENLKDLFNTIIDNLDSSDNLYIINNYVLENFPLC